MICLQTGPFGVNTYIVKLTGSAVFIVDPAACDFCHDGSKIVDYLKENNLNPVAMIFTHGHFDHVAGINNLKKEYPELPVLIHRNDSEMLDPQKNSSQIDTLKMMGFEDFIPTVSNLWPVDIYLEDGATLDSLLGAYITDTACLSELSRWKVIHTPGHTPGCVCLYNSSRKILISGDTVFYRSYGRTDLPGGDERQIMLSLKNIYNYIPLDVKVYPGHDYYGFDLKDNV